MERNIERERHIESEIEKIIDSERKRVSTRGRILSEREEEIGIKREKQRESKREREREREEEKERERKREREDVLF
jgi:hypothetical protein